MSYSYDRRKTAAGRSFDVGRLERLAESMEHEVAQISSSVGKYKQNPGRMEPQLDNAVKSAIAVESLIRAFYRTLGPEFTGKL